MSAFVLGSASPRRRRLLAEAGYDFDVVTVDADEICDSASPVGTVVHNALAKLAACRVLRPQAPILTADTLVWFEGRLVGKPTTLDEARRFLRAFSGKEQTVFTAVAFARSPDAAPALRVEASLVRFKMLDDAAIDAYVALVNPLDRAGAYDISDHGMLVVEAVEGSVSNVAGLPMESVAELLGEGDWKK